MQNQQGTPKREDFRLHPLEDTWSIEPDLGANLDLFLMVDYITREQNELKDNLSSFGNN